MILDFIKKLQKKPRHIRLQIMWAAVVISMFLILSFWLWSFQSSGPTIVSAKPSDNKVVENLKQLKEAVPTLWQSLTAGLGNILKSPAADETPPPTTPQHSETPPAELPVTE